MTKREAAEYWRKSTDTVERWAVRLKWERHFDPSGNVLFLREQVTKSGKPVHRNKIVNFKAA